MSTSAVSYTLRFLSSFRGPNAATPAVASDVRAGVADLAGSVMWLKTQLFDIVVGAEQRVIGVAGNQLEITGHGLAANTPVQIFATSGGSIPTPLSANTVYYVRNIDPDHIELSASSGPGAAVTLTSGMSGDVWVQTVPDWISSLMVSNATYGTGKLKDLIVWLAGTQSITGAKTFANLTMSGTNRVTLATRTVTRGIQPYGFSDTDGPVIVPKVIATSDTVDFVIDVPDGSTITQISVTIDPDAHGSLPATMPEVRLVRVNVTTGASVDIGTHSDTSADAAAFSAAHTITLSALSEVVDRSAYYYMVRFAQEAGAGSIDGEYKGGVWSASVSSYDDGAG